MFVIVTVLRGRITAVAILCLLVGGGGVGGWGWGMLSRGEQELRGGGLELHVGCCFSSLFLHAHFLDHDAQRYQSKMNSFGFISLTQ